MSQVIKKTTAINKYNGRATYTNVRAADIDCGADKNKRIWDWLSSTATNCILPSAFTSTTWIGYTSLYRFHWFIFAWRHFVMRIRWRFFVHLTT